jgi:hypothetical protein
VLLRIVGIVFLCLGAILVAVGVTAIQHASSIMSLSTEFAQSRNRPFDASTWLAHWRVWALVDICTGGAIAAGGAAVALKKRCGLLLLGMVLLLAAVAPWVIQWAGLARYGFERASLTDSAVLLPFAFLSIWGYFLPPTGRTDA